MRRNVLIVDDSPVFCRILATLLRSIEGVEVVGTAHSGERALELLTSRDPDLVTLDVLMPGRDGLETLRALRHKHPELKVLMISSRTRRGAVETVESLQLGASDYLAKPSGLEPASRDPAAKLAPQSGLETLAQGLRRKLDDLLPLQGAGLQDAPLPPPRILPRSSPPPTSIEVVAIACSTGGPAALAELLERLPADLPVPVLVVQHILPEFVAHLVRSLARRSRLALCEASAGTQPRPGTVHFAPNSVHTVVAGGPVQPRFSEREAPPLHGCRPAADLLFESLPPAFGGRVLALVLTGTGEDGSAGSGSIRRAGGWVIAQRLQECVAVGMPGAAIKAGHVDEVLALGDMPERITELAWRGRR